MISKRLGTMKKKIAAFMAVLMITSILMPGFAINARAAGTGTEESPYSVSEAISYVNTAFPTANASGTVSVEGYIVGIFTTSSPAGLIIADSSSETALTDKTKVMYVIAHASTVSNTTAIDPWNKLLADNTTPASFGKKIKVTGTWRAKAKAAYGTYGISTVGTVSGANLTITEVSNVSTVAAPTANPASGAVSVNTPVTLSSTTSDAAITYQLNGGAETLYTTPIILSNSAFVNGTATIQAKAAKEGSTTSQAVTFTYTIASDIPTVAAPTASPASGAVSTGQAITLSSATTGASITYQLNGGAETVYTAPITLDTNAFVNGTATIQAKAAKDGSTTSQAVTFTYTLKTLPDIITTQDAKTKAASTQVRVKGIVTYSTQGRTIFLQDATGGICVDSGSSSINISGNVGKEIDVTGTITLYGNMAQVKPASVNDIVVTNPTPTMPEPLVVTISQLNTTNRAHEGKLIKVVNAQIKTIGGTGTSTYNHIIRQGTNEITLRAGALTGKNVDDYITITGIAGYYNTPQVQANVVDVVNGVAPSISGVTANPPTGSAVASGSAITLTTATTDASIVYTLNGGAEQTIASNSGTVVINEFTSTSGQAIIKARATKGTDSSAEATFAYTQAKTQTVSANPVGAVSGNSQITLTAANGATIKYVLTKKVGMTGEVSDPEAIYTTPIQITEEMLPAKITAYATQNGYLQSSITTFNYRLASNAAYQNYFGQLHSHTTNSDGAGTLQEAFDWARDIAKLDFFAVTDHSNSYDKAPAADKAGTYNLGAYNKDNVNWQAGITAATNAARAGSFVSFYGYEMTWSGGPGHMNTFNTEGFVSRNNTELNNKTNDGGLRAYYDLLKLHPESISQFNHPGNTFGNFSNFAYYDPTIDERISLIEVGNGEGAIGSGGYFPSYEQYDMALDKGWHVAPTNNQDNHKAMWGNANTARTVIYTNDFTKEGIYQAMKDMRVYATEDANLDIVYTLNNQQLGSILENVPATANFKVTAKNKVGTKIKSIAIITNGGAEAYKMLYGAADVTMDYTITAPKAGYYYIKVVQEDGRIAVTAPVWLGAIPKVGITGVTSSTTTPVTTEKLTLTTEVFNNEAIAATVKSIKYQIKGGSVITENALTTAVAIDANTSIKNTLDFTPTVAEKTTIVVTVTVMMNGEEKTYTREIELNVKDITKLKFIGIDASHLNEYVAGNYKDGMGNLSAIAMQYGLRTVILNTSEDLIAAASDPRYRMLIITAPTRRLDPATGITHKYYSDAEVAAIANFAKLGNPVVLTGWGDYYESYTYVTAGLENHMAAQQNKILAAIGSTLRVSDDEAKDDVNNGGQAPRLYLTDHNGNVSPLLSGMLSGQKFSQYGGSTLYAVNPDGTPATILPASIIPIASGHSTTYSSDDDKDGYGFADKTITIPRYGNSPDAGKGVGKVLVAASETVNHSNGITSQVIVSGGAFMSNFEIKNTSLDNPADAYSNEVIVRNLLASIENIIVTPIAEVKKAAAGKEFTIEGIATVSVYEQSGTNKGFFDSIYVQDATGGINLFPVSSGVQAGYKIRVTGTVSSYQGEQQLAVSSIKVLNSEITTVTPTAVSTKESMSATNTGRLIKTKGVVTRVVTEPNGTVNEITINDGTGPAIVYINAYITTDTSLAFVKEGAIISVTGLGSVGENFTSTTEFLPRIRVRDRSEIKLVTPVIDNTVKFNADGSATVENVNATLGQRISIAVLAPNGNNPAADVTTNAAITVLTPDIIKIENGKIVAIKNGQGQVEVAYNGNKVTVPVNVKIDECFIATAAYGTKFQPSVVLLRKFRDEFLLTNPVGKAFVNFYYKNSPPIANFIAQNSILKAVVRVLLTPLVAVAYLLIHPILGAAVLLALAFGITLLVRRRRNKNHVTPVAE